MPNDASTALGISPSPHDELKSYEPTLSERATGAIQDTLMGLGASSYPAGHIAHGITDAASWLPPIGIPFAASAAQKSASQGDIAGTAIAAAGVMPGGKVEAKAMEDITKKIGAAFEQNPQLAAKFSEALTPIRAYHGSPHNFEKFSMQSIGTGEGFQSYGHGLYFAENPAVAEAYKPDLEAVAKAIKGHIPSSELPAGKMYEVDIHANPEHFLHWDKALEQQPKWVQDALARLIRDEPEIARRFDSLITGGNITRGTPNPKGADLYSVVGRGVTKGKTGEKADRAASETLKDVGVPGIKYLDQGSRHTGYTRINETPIGFQAIYQAPLGGTSTNKLFSTKGDAEAWVAEQAKGATSNYVLFRDDIIKIIKKYGLAAFATPELARETMQKHQAETSVDKK